MLFCVGGGVELCMGSRTLYMPTKTELTIKANAKLCPECPGSTGVDSIPWVIFCVLHLERVEWGVYMRKESLLFAVTSACSRRAIPSALLKWKVASHSYQLLQDQGTQETIFPYCDISSMGHAEFSEVMLGVGVGIRMEICINICAQSILLQSCFSCVWFETQGIAIGYLPFNSLNKDGRRQHVSATATRLQFWINNMDGYSVILYMFWHRCINVSVEHASTK